MRLKTFFFLVLPICFSSSFCLAQNSDLCFKRQAGTNFHYTDNHQTHVKIENITFNDNSAIAVISESGGILFKDIFDLTGRRLIANLMYAIEDLKQIPTELISEIYYHAPYPQFPSNLQIGQKFEIQLNPLHLNNNTASTPEHMTLNMQFKGFENMDLITADDQALSLKNVCHFSTQTDVGFFDEWYAEGYGLIQSIQKSVNGTIISIQSIGQTP